MASNRGRMPLMTMRLAALQQRLWDEDEFTWRSRLANALSGVRYWLWFLTGGWRA